MKRWGVVNNPLVKVVAELSVLLFLALNLPTAFVIILVGILLYAIALLGVVHAYRRQYWIVGDLNLHSSLWQRPCPTPRRIAAAR